MQLATFLHHAPPERAEVLRVASTGGLGLRVAIFRPPAGSAILGTILLLQGRAEFIEKYYETIRDLLERGLVVVAPDWRGQGGSDRQLRDRRKGHVDDFDDYVADLDAVLTQAALPSCPQPFYALAHSMGATVLLHALHQGEQRLSRAVLSAPMLGLVGLPTGGPAAMLASLLNTLALGGAYVPGGGATARATRPFAGNKLTHDPVRYQVMADMIAEAHWLGLGDPTIGWVHAAYRAMERVDQPGFGESIRVPTLVLIPGADPLVSPEVTARIVPRLRAARDITLPGALHELLFETETIREQVFAAFDAFVPGSTLVTA